MVVGDRFFNLVDFQACHHHFLAQVRRRVCFPGLLQGFRDRRPGCG